MARRKALVYVVRRRVDLLERIIPFFERTPLLSSKQRDFQKFAEVVRAMAQGHHRTESGFSKLLAIALSMNGGGRFRKVRWQELIPSHPESSETVRRTGLRARKIQSELHGDMQSQAEMS